MTMLTHWLVVCSICGRKDQYDTTLGFSSSMLSGDILRNRLGWRMTESALICNHCDVTLAAA